MLNAKCKCNKCNPELYGHIAHLKVDVDVSVADAVLEKLCIENGISGFHKFRKIRCYVWGCVCGVRTKHHLLVLT